jgi:hypothetical protein
VSVYPAETHVGVDVIDGLPVKVTEAMAVCVVDGVTVAVAVPVATALELGVAVVVEALEEPARAMSVK